MTIAELLTQPWWLDACRLRVGLLKRPQPQVPHLTRPKYAAALDELNRFAAWLAWFQAGRKGPRPVGIWTRVPHYAWVIQGEYALAHPKPASQPPPPPGQQPRSRWTAPPFAGRGCHFTWGFTTGFPDGDHTPEDMAGRLADHGYAWAALEGYPASAGATTPDGRSLDNTPHHAPFKAALHARARRYGLWHRADQLTAEQAIAEIHQHAPDFYLADIEVFPNPDDPAAIAKAFPDLPRAVLIAGMPDASTCKPWIDADFDCMTQAYTGPNSLQTAGSMDSGAKWRGWALNACDHYSWPVLEINAEGSKSLRAQLDDVAPWNGNYSVYAAELYQPDDWAV